MARKAGYYRVKKDSAWIIRSFNGESWYEIERIWIDGDTEVDDSYFEEINEERIPMPGDAVSKVVVLPAGVTAAQWVEITERMNGFAWQWGENIFDLRTEIKRFNQKVDGGEYIIPRILPTKFESKEEFEKAYRTVPILDDRTVELYNNTGKTITIPAGTLIGPNLDLSKYANPEIDAKDIIAHSETGDLLSVTQDSTGTFERRDSDNAANVDTEYYADCWFKVDYTFNPGDAHMSFKCYRITRLAEQVELSDIEQRETLDGSIKWDGCMNFTSNDHHCDIYHADQVLQVIKHIRNKANETIQGYEGETFDFTEQDDSDT